MIEYTLIKTDQENNTGFSRQDIADFLYTHLDEYGDAKEHILKCIAYAYGDKPGQDGHILLAFDTDTDTDTETIVGAVIINKTNMSGYIPENILVYIAVDSSQRGKGIGKQLMQRTINQTEGDIALHVEPENKARLLYEKYGFTNKYLEYRLTR